MTLKFARNANANGAAPAADDGDGDALEDSRSTPQRRVAPSTPYPRDTSPRDSESSELAETHTGHSVATQSYEELAEFKTILSDVSDPSAHRAMMRAAAAEAAQPRTSSPAPPASKARRWTSFLPSFGSFKKTFSPPPAPRARRSFHG
mmetsp:Transcript_19759/g.60889  ORF Transcript_19759/g.60889 Transcript_19759/m.60889 type:complete len:148 (+) Transcript_19759:111-554(+)